MFKKFLYFFSLNENIGHTEWINGFGLSVPSKNPHVTSIFLNFRSPKFENLKIHQFGLLRSLSCREFITEKTFCLTFFSKSNILESTETFRMCWAVIILKIHDWKYDILLPRVQATVLNILS